MVLLYCTVREGSFARLACLTNLTKVAELLSRRDSPYLKAGRSPLPTNATRLELKSISALPIPPFSMEKR